MNTSDTIGYYKLPSFGVSFILLGEACVQELKEFS